MSTSYVCRDFFGSYPALNVTQTFVYVNGDLDFVARYTVTNPEAAATRFRAVSRGVFSAAGSGRGQGFFDGTSPRVIGMFNDAQGSEGGFVEVASTPWSRYLEGTAGLYPSPLDGGESDVFGGGLDNTVDATLVTDPHAAVQFDRYTSLGLAPGATDSFEVRWFFGHYDGLSLSPASGTQPAGAAQTVTATSLNHGEPVVGGVVRWAVTGANPVSGSVSTGATGTATIAWSGNQPGQDTLTAYLDSDGDGSYDPEIDTQQTATFSWTAPSAPAAALPAPPAPSLASAAPAKAQPGCRLTGNVILGGRGDDIRNGTPATDIIFGSGGRDVLRGLGGRDCLYGERGADRLLGGVGDDRLFGGPGNDRLSGQAGGDRLVDASGRDDFEGGPGDDEIDARDSSRAGRRQADRVRCGLGRRDRALVDRRDRVARDCEGVRRR